MVRSTWQSRDLPVLNAIVEAIGEQLGAQIRPPEIAERTGLELADVEKALAALWLADPAYLDGFAPEEAVYPVLVTAVTERALRETEQWPSGTGIVDALVEAFQREADMELEPERKSRLLSIVNGLSGFARDVAVGVVSAKLSGL
jgi:hypothetical protein